MERQDPMRTSSDNGKLRNKKENESFFYNGEYLKLYQNRKDKEVTPGWISLL